MFFWRKTAKYFLGMLSYIAQADREAGGNGPAAEQKAGGDEEEEVGFANECGDNQLREPVFGTVTCFNPHSS